MSNNGTILTSASVSMANKGVRKRSGKRTRKETWTETEGD